MKNVGLCLSIYGTMWKFESKSAYFKEFRIRIHTFESLIAEIRIQIRICKCELSHYHPTRILKVILHWG